MVITLTSSRRIKTRRELEDYCKLLAEIGYPEYIVDQFFKTGHAIYKSGEAETTLTWHLEH